MLLNKKTAVTYASKPLESRICVCMVSKLSLQIYFTSLYNYAEGKGRKAGDFLIKLLFFVNNEKTVPEKKVGTVFRFTGLFLLMSSAEFGFCNCSVFALFPFFGFSSTFCFFYCCHVPSLLGF